MPQRWLMVLVAVALDGTHCLIEQTIVFADKEQNITLPFLELLQLNKNVKAFEDKCALSTRIINGELAEPEDVPYQILLRAWSGEMGRWFGYCGGALVTLSHVLTAAHCVRTTAAGAMEVARARLVAGTKQRVSYVKDMSDESWRSVRSFLVHNAYVGAPTYDVDFAIALASRPFSEGYTIKAVRIHSADLKEELPSGTLCMLSGFGFIREHSTGPLLKKTCVPLVSRKDCLTVYSSEHLTRNKICAGGRYMLPNTNTTVMSGACRGDSGGPIVCRGLLTGLVSTVRLCERHQTVFTALQPFTAPAVASLPRYLPEPFPGSGAARTARPGSAATAAAVTAVILSWRVACPCFPECPRALAFRGTTYT